jgi:hypothetical protein
MHCMPSKFSVTPKCQIPISLNELVLLSLGGIDAR